MHFCFKHFLKIFFVCSVVSTLVGMRYLAVKGLGSFLYRINRLKDDPKKINYSGSMQDKILGLREAINLAKRKNPCVLHLINFDEELSNNENDVSSSEKGKKMLDCVFHQDIDQFVYGIDDDNNLISKCPCIQIVISGRFSSMNVLSLFPFTKALEISKPDLVYAKYLWQNNYTKKEPCLITDEQIDTNLLGKSATEICHFKYLYSQQNESLQTFFDENHFPNQKHSNIPQVSWDDVGGLSHIKEEIWNDITLPVKLMSSASSSDYNIRSRHRRGLLLYGPPGTGKTLVAKAIATTCQLPFINIKGPELIGSYVGESESNIRNLFHRARKEAASLSPSFQGVIIFFDEIDSLSNRHNQFMGDSSGNAVMNRIVSTLLTELDKCRHDHDSFIFVIGATNRPDLLDSSLLRPGRFDRMVYLGLSNTPRDQGLILKACMRKFKFNSSNKHSNSDLQHIIDQLIPHIPKNLTGADLTNLTKIALMNAIRRKCDTIDKDVQSITSLQNQDNSKDEILDPLEQVIQKYSKDELLEPFVTLQDLIDAAKEVVPSVNTFDLQKYEALKIKYSNQRT